MRGAQIQLPGATNALGHKLAVGHRGDLIGRAGDDQGRRADGAQLLAEIRITHRRAVAGVADRRGGGEHIGDALHLPRFGRGKARGKPAGDGGIAQLAHGLLAALQHAVDPAVPHLIIGDLRCGIAQHQAGQALGGVKRQPLADQTAHGQAAEGETLDIQGIDQGQHIATQLLDAVGPWRDQRAAMAAGVVAQHAKVLAERRHLGIPHLQVGTQGIGQHQHRRIGRAIQLVMQGAIGELEHGHCKSSIRDTAHIRAALQLKTSLGACVGCAMRTGKTEDYSWCAWRTLHFIGAPLRSMDLPFRPDRSSAKHQTRSMASARPWPTPTHMVARPRLPAVFSS